MEIRLAGSPVLQYEHDILSFLSKSLIKDELWLWHLNLAVRGKLDKLESRFYLGLLKDKIVSNASTWEYGPLGVVGHLFTAGKYRRKGACTAIMKRQIRDFRKRGGKVLIGGFKETSYSIAKNLGFKSIVNRSEVMHYELHPGFKSEYFHAKKVSCRDSMWKDWPGVSLLFGAREGWRIRSMKHKIFGAFDYEEHFLEDMRERLEGLCISKVLTSEKGSIVGYATLTFKRGLRDGYWLLDFFVHHASASYADSLLDAMDFPAGKIRCYVDLKSDGKRDILSKRGFKEKTRKQTKHDGKILDTSLMELQ